MENTVNDINNEVENSPDEKKKSPIGRIINICLTVALFTFIFAIMLRICQADHKELKNLAKTEAYENAFSISQDVRTHVAGSEFSENGAIYAYSYVYIPDARYLQITVRYNNRHIDEVINAINENEKTENGASAKTYTWDDIGIYYTFTDSTGKEYTPTVINKAEKFSYTYFQLEVTDVDFDTDALNVNMMLKNIEKTQVENNGNSLTTLKFKEGNDYNSASLEFHTKDDTYIPYEK